MKLLPRSEWTLHVEAVGIITVGAYERDGYRCFTKVALPNPLDDCISFDDLERFVVDKFNIQSSAQNVRFGTAHN
jgi:hypothetical protein